MENMNLLNNELIAYTFKQYHHSLFLYFYCSIGMKEEAEDLMQDSFLRLAEYDRMLRPDTVKYFLLTIARNLKVDYLRRYSRRDEFISDYLYVQSVSYENTADQSLNIKELLDNERKRMDRMPLQRRRIYSMVRFEEKNVAEIARDLNLSVRTVENHLAIGRKEMRAYLSLCV